MRRMIAAIVGLWAAVLVIDARAQVTVMAVRLGASDVVALAKFYDAAFGLKEIDRVGNPATEIIMRFGATVAEAKAGASPEFLVQKREGAAKDPMHHPIFRVSDITATVAGAKAAGATAAKVCGAGGGGCLFCYGPPSAREAIRTALVDGGARLLEYTFERHGLGRG